MEPLHATHNPWWTFDTLGDKTYKDLLSDKQRATAREPEKRLCCRMCGQVITHEKDRIEINGAHTHGFSNPHSLQFHIGCFGGVNGCVEIGISTREFTWFPGYAWRVALCRSCHEHLGWKFRSDSNDSFYGLILNRLSYPH
jgi:uncharacterized C2H2 Zn-finger protein